MLDLAPHQDRELSHASQYRAGKIPLAILSDR